jgi:hypothetical protein
MNKYTHMAWQTYRNYYKVGLALWCLTPLQLYRGDFTMKNINGVRTNKFIYLFIYSNCILHPYGSSNYNTKACKHIKEKQHKHNKYVNVGDIFDRRETYPLKSSD